ncbi:MAG: type II toxin-antitoxin system VapC family toxin [Brevundimonas sp.]|uniref:type II toxin-antitoxin system VapC family toxin n=1 Tax=Brevundimonas sp. TaxID=1871086 RepID=UPI002718D00A|nr:type II toxin-antitoxin system VapC family toxin [Brevundimonas sp.]MDO9587931.1 type II toxin-antitoxin system VapC family toxin [Brevundimonas sp.]MDP3369363.1 type II toxin-antitoxin system VapC family toxin [Brevundimonas sp.]MDP3657362.1 type II toxin-antitoxin system VapC family toxin [Brevundimonas sp.]MDZ4320159.1 type II toxin-antitoxin system VapC family toxin [Phenylobacterium sp.]
MIIDTSALVAIIRSESDGQNYFEVLRDAVESDIPLRISAVSLFELYLVIDKERNERLSGAADEVLAQFPLEVVSIDREHAVTARVAHQRFGRGSGSAARLNFGDCFSYALARETGEPLLFKGNDFSHTDVEPALK